MDRATVYFGQLARETDILLTGQNTMVALAKLAAGVLGTSAIANGFTCIPTGPASLNVIVTPGEIYQLENTEQSTWSSLSTNTTSILKQGLVLTNTTFGITPPGTVGFSQNFLVEVQYQDIDSGSTVLPYYNASNPALPFSGPGNAGTAQNTVRQGVAALQVKAGTAATTGTQTTPTADAGWSGLFVVTVANGATTITSGNIATYSAAPFIPSTLPAIPTGVLNGTWIGCTDTSGAGGTVTVLISAAGFNPSSYVAGMTLRVKMANDCSGPTVINLNGLGNKTIVKQPNSLALTGREWRAGDIIRMTYDGTNFQMAAAAQASPAIVGTVRNLSGSSAGGVVTASWTMDELIAETVLGGTPYRGISLSLSFNGATTGANGMDIGSVPTSAPLHIYAIYNPTTNTWATLGTTSGTGGSIYPGAHMPSGYVASCVLWSGVTDGSAHFRQWSQVDRTIYLAGFRVLASGGAVTWTAIDISAYIPPNARTVSGWISTNSGNTNIALAGTNTGLSTIGGIGNTGSATISASYNPIAILTSQTIYYEVVAGTADVYVSTYWL